MKMIVGLGNPESKYDGTRHNVGFRVLDTLAEQLGTDIKKSQLRALTGTAVYEGEKLLLVKPQTYMNLSGESVKPLADYYGIATEDILIIVDDVNMDVGKLRIRGGGSAGGHNGLKNLILHLGTDQFPRLRVGVGMPDGASLIERVLEKIPKSEDEQLTQAAKIAAEEALFFCTHGMEETMNTYNGLWRQEADGKI
ncbi:MAG: aminoacyl-tRNA hydrolase [Lachnospiraceae bacterium]|nr:aminoacyl-tRNA hydrolase [Candidatus Minthocola equi]